MSDLNTKQKILNASIQLFNENGLSNVRLQQIASEIGISTGNLAYHFKNKEAIVATINTELIQESSEILSCYRVYPNLMDLDHQLSKYFSFIQRYPFYFLDLLELDRRYPEMLAKRQAQINKMIDQIRKRFDYNVQRGIIIAEPYEGVYDLVSNTIWVTITFWVSQHVVRSDENHRSEQQFRRAVWTQFLPYLTEMGQVEYEMLIQPILKHLP